MGRSKKDQLRKKKAKLVQKKRALKKNTSQEEKSTRPKKKVVSKNLEPDLTVAESKSKYNIDQLLDKTEDYIDTFNYELAQKFCQRALELDPENTRALETSGMLLLEMGDAENAKKCFGRAVAVQPNEGHSKYMYLGQICEGQQAVECFQKGIELMLKGKEKENQGQKIEGACACPDEDMSATDRDISKAYCSIAEIYLTDSCFEADAEDRCKSSLDKAIEYNSNNAEALQLLSSYHLSKNNLQEAKDVLNKSLSLWLPQWQQFQLDADGIDALEPCPLDYQCRITTAKLLIELQMFEKSIDVLENLLEEDDEVVIVWYLIGWSNYLLTTDEHKKAARFYLQSAHTLFSKVQCDDDEMLKHIEELLKELGPGEEEDEEEDDEVTMDADDFSSCSSEDDEMEQ
ncbi:uncharacterized protein LOC102807988 [Saccoglossus kowalevskii]